MKKLSIDPITRLEGHGKIDIFLNDEGEVANCYFLVPELRGFEKFCEGRPVEELPRILTRICGVCPEAHHMASAKACDAVYHVEIPRAGRLLRELIYAAFCVADHTVHFYALGGPDFVVGPDAPPAERNVLGLIRKVGLEAGKKVIRTRSMVHEIIDTVGGKAIHPVSSIPGGITTHLTEEQRSKFIEYAKEMVEFGKFSIKVVDDIVLANKAYVDLILSDTYAHKTHSMGIVDENNHVNFYDGKIRVVDTKGKEIHKFDARDYKDVLAEHVEPWTYLKFPYIKSIGWKGFIDGQDSGVYKATPLSRLNAGDGMATPLAQAEYERFYETLGGKPVHATLATHWARVIELLYAAEWTLNTLQDPEITSTETRVIPTETPDEGIGVVEAPRGTLYHHYITNDKGIVQKVNLIVGTTNNHAAISMSIKKAAHGLIKKGTEITDATLNMIEMAFRAYDPCFACATHSLPGQMPLELRIRSPQGEIIDRVKRL
ncbi:MAG: Ni/Fe hydrogenase subunit alpha [Candidatus Latescibacteria bacterium]|nr:Ni/Fe hydrogenase subunit alpha [Candidatus Latescibacterota bacterium]NIO27221.1 Ni/Fe hydrogenase subunit alpha [Candidatus Latescibacterota bacterium]NIO54745.1 Ni/Fe hydrogenase subunit alpha [Candidatus Latescibacterota bacterium]NIT00828.1 Ni/Fe hydrogenase subunit alpha [Candidatus Latescibacterota bacterium]NIT37751.1 Ni/Fe hydrogenase subunit alpha [Candidatus Latescibacterota bacterium]